MARILLIDDDYSMRTTVRLILVRMGHTVIEACNGVEGLNLFSSADPDLVITDIVMPEKEGLEVIMALRAQQPPVKIIAMSGDAMLCAASNLHAARLLGAVNVLEKPFSLEALRMAVDDTLTSGRTPSHPSPVPALTAC